MGLSLVNELGEAYPDSVSRVRPPKTTMPNTLTADPINQYPTVLELILGNDLAVTPSTAGFAHVWLSSDSGDDLFDRTDGATSLTAPDLVNLSTAELEIGRRASDCGT